MNILNPELVWINNACYRLPALPDDVSSGAGGQTPFKFDNTADPPPYIEDPEDLRPTLCMAADEPPDMENDIEVTDSGTYRLRLPIPKVFWARLVGARGMAKRRVEEETRTSLTIPRPTEEGPVVIKGNSQRDVLLAKSHIEDSVRAGRQCHSYTHFLSIRLANEEITKNFAEFKTKALEINPSLSEELFTPPERLHLTIVMLCLVDNRERQEAIEMLNQLRQILVEKIRNQPIIVTVAGLDTMNDDTSRTSIVFAKVNHPLVLELANTAAAYYHDTGYVKQRDIREFVKLHVTVMNSRYLKQDEGDAPERGQRYRGRPPRVEFDASRIFEEMEDYHFGTAQVTKICMSQLGNHSPEDGYYVSSAEINLCD